MNLHDRAWYDPLPGTNTSLGICETTTGGARVYDEHNTIVLGVLPVRAPSRVAVCVNQHPGTRLMGDTERKGYSGVNQICAFNSVYVPR